MPILWKPFWSSDSEEAVTQEAQEATEEGKGEAVITLPKPENPTPNPEPEPIPIGTPAISSQGFSEASLANMSYDEINENWDNIIKQLEA